MTLPTLIVTVLAWTALTIFLIWLPSWWLWNQLLVPVFELPSLSFWQSSGLLVYVWLVRQGVAKVKFGEDSD